MILPQPQRFSRNNTGRRPYEELFIYYLKGRLHQHHPIFQNNFIGNWEEEEDSILFFSRSADLQIEKLLQRQPHLKCVDSYRMPYEQWLGETFSTFEQGAFRIVPSWEITENRVESSTAKLEILLDPGLVFGTGTHSTTRACLEALEIAAGSMQMARVLDIGTGTGLLALAAARLGGERILGVDLNLLAAKTAGRNVKLNQLEDRIVIAQGRAEDMIACPADLLIANIHFDVMNTLITTGDFLAKKRFILSGLMRGEAKHIANILQRYPLKILKQWRQDGIWHTFYGKTLRT